MTYMIAERLRYNEAMETEFKDRGGKVIHFGDIVQYRLSALSQGPFIVRVIRGKHGRVVLVDPRSTSNNGLKLCKKYEKYISIVDTSGRKHYEY